MIAYRRRWRRRETFQRNGSDTDTGHHAGAGEVEALARAAVSMTPEVLARLEALAAALARVRPGRRVDALVQTNGRRVFEPLPAHAARARILVAVLVQVVLLQVHLQR